MLNNNKDIKRICSFYVSEWHLISMLLPYINKEMEENKEVLNISENNLDDLVKVFVSRLNLAQENESRILNIDWNNRKAKNIRNNQIIIISGTKDYIDKVNLAINKKVKSTEKKITIINCYEVMQFNNNINEILGNHEKVLNTSGEKEIFEVFEGYQENSGVVNQ